jgi:hypothetical protein
METIQLAISNAPYAKALRDLLTRTGSLAVIPVEVPDAGGDGVLVVDSEALERMPFPLPNPDTVVLITHNDPQHLAQAWEAGIHSVVFDHDPLSTVALAVMAARLRVPKAMSAEGAHPPPHLSSLPEAGPDLRRGRPCASGQPSCRSKPHGKRNGNAPK